MNILKKYKDFACKRGNILLFEIDQMLEIIEDCRKESLRIYGFDGFKIGADTIQPFSEHSIDFSTLAADPNVYDLSRNFILSKKSTGLMFEIVLDDDEGL